MILIPKLYITLCPPEEESKIECTTMKEETELTMTEHHQIQNDATGLCLHHEAPNTQIVLYDCMETTQRGIF